MTTVHFVYALPQNSNILKRAYRRFMHREMLRASAASEYSWPSPLRAPYSITFHLCKFLENKYNIRLYDLTERITIVPECGDILLGHMWPDHKSIMWNSIRDSRFKKKYLIAPYNNDELQVGFLRESLDEIDQFFAICGDYWGSNMEQSPLKRYKDKLRFINMAVDVVDYPYVKTVFNPPEKRRFLYIGRAGRRNDEKGIKLLEELSRVVPNFQGGYICGGGEIKGWERISPPTKLTPHFMTKLAEKYDIFINMSRADAQATTILEAMSWGFPVACTKQSGYSEEPTLFYLTLGDIEQNVRKIREIQTLPESELFRMAVKNREIVENKYNWTRFVENFIYL